MTPAPMAARKRADLLSITGAAIAGAAVGAWLAAAVRPWAGAILALGLAVHATGMAARHRLDRREGPLPRVWQALYVVCWLLIAATIGALVLRTGVVG